MVLAAVVIVSLLAFFFLPVIQVGSIQESPFNSPSCQWPHVCECCIFLVPIYGSVSYRLFGVGGMLTARNYTFVR